MQLEARGKNQHLLHSLTLCVCLILKNTIKESFQVGEDVLETNLRGQVRAALQFCCE